MLSIAQRKAPLLQSTSSEITALGTTASDGPCMRQRAGAMRASICMLKMAGTMRPQCGCWRASCARLQHDSPLVSMSDRGQHTGTLRLRRHSCTFSAGHAPHRVTHRVSLELCAVFVTQALMLVDATPAPFLRENICRAPHGFACIHRRKHMTTHGGRGARDKKEGVEAGLHGLHHRPVCVLELVEQHNRQTASVEVEVCS